MDHRHIKSVRGLTIKGISVKDTNLRIRFQEKNGVEKSLTIWDDARSCCEYRYMRTDDDISWYLGSEFLDVELSDGPTENDDENCMITQSQFLKITTSKGVFTVVSYNRHNGYYGGFEIRTTLGRSDENYDQSI